MRYPAEHKANTHAKIVKTAARCFCARGIDAVGVVDLMDAVGLTHGGFYNHFSSKDTLVAEAVKHGLEGSRNYLDKWGHGAPAGVRPFDVIIARYLSPLHRDAIDGTGCPLPALSAEVARSSKGIKLAYSKKLKEIVGLLQEFAPRRTADRQAVAVAALSALVGAVVLARAVPDRDYSDWILQANQSFLVEVMARLDGGTGSRRRRSKRSLKH